MINFIYLSNINNKIKRMTLNYIGSKKKLLPFIDHVIMSNVEEKDISGNKFGDLFSGTGIVGEYFSKKGFTITSNDKENYSYPKF